MRAYRKVKYVLLVFFNKSESEVKASSFEQIAFAYKIDIRSPKGAKCG